MPQPSSLCQLGIIIWCDGDVVLAIFKMIRYLDPWGSVIWMGVMECVSAFGLVFVGVGLELSRVALVSRVVLRNAVCVLLLSPLVPLQPYSRLVPIWFNPSLVDISGNALCVDGLLDWLLVGCIPVMKRLVIVSCVDEGYRMCFSGSRWH